MPKYKQVIEGDGRQPIQVGGNVMKLVREAKKKHEDETGILVSLRAFIEGLLKKALRVK